MISAHKSFRKMKLLQLRVYLFDLSHPHPFDSSAYGRMKTLIESVSVWQLFAGSDEVILINIHRLADMNIYTLNLEC